MICVGQAAYGVDQALGNNTLVTPRLYVVSARRERRLCRGLYYPRGCKRFLEVCDGAALIVRPREEPRQKAAFLRGVSFV